MGINERVLLFALYSYTTKFYYHMTLFFNFFLQMLVLYNMIGFTNNHVIESNSQTSDVTV